MLKPELMAPGAIEGLPPDELATKRSAAAAAAGALRACCAALGPGELDALVLRDVCVEDLMQYLGISSSGSDGGSGPWWAGPAATQELPGRARGRLACIAAILGAVSSQTLCMCRRKGCGAACTTEGAQVRHWSALCMPVRVVCSAFPFIHNQN
jgi:hypothetical protein